MKYSKIWGLVAVAAAGSLVPVHAQYTEYTTYAQQSAYTAKDAHLRAGPSRDYPVVAIVRAGFPITVMGCLSDYLWCDVVVGHDRGWMYSGNIYSSYQGEQVPVISYGAAIGIGIIVFSIAHYWDHHYVERPWYPQRHLWINRPAPPPVHRPAPPPARPPVAPTPRPDTHQPRTPPPPPPVVAPVPDSRPRVVPPPSPPGQVSPPRPTRPPQGPVTRSDPHPVPRATPEREPRSQPPSRPGAEVSPPPRQRPGPDGPPSNRDPSPERGR